MKGRLLFYASYIAWFDLIPLVENEPARIVGRLGIRAHKTYAVARRHQTLDSNAVLDRLRGGLLTRDEADGVKRFARIAGEPLTKGAKKRQARAAGYAYEPVLSVLEELGAEMFVRPNERSGT